MEQDSGNQSNEKNPNNEEDLNEQPSAPETTQVTDTDSVDPTTEPVSKPEKRSSRKKWLLIAGGVVVVLAVVASLLFLHHSGKKAAVQPTTKSSKKATQVAPPTVSLEGTYLAEPQDLTQRPNLFNDYKAIFGIDCSGQPNTNDTNNCPASFQASDMVYKQIGTTSDGKPIIIAGNGTYGIDGRNFILLKTGTGSYSILGKFDPEFFQSDQDGKYDMSSYNSRAVADFKKALDPSTTLDIATDLPDLAFPAKFTFQSATFKNDQEPHFAGYPLFNGLSDLRSVQLGGSTDTSKVKKLGNDGPRIVYQVIAQDAANYSVKEVYETINAVYAASYLLDEGIASADKAPTLHWSDGTSTQDRYADRAAGCGSGTGYIAAKNLSASDLDTIGTGPGGQTLYAMPTASPLFQQIYKEDYGNGDNLGNASFKHLSADQLQARHAIFVAKNGLGEYVVYKNENYFQGGGCAKPVVYLYPTKSELVSVSVGAQITKSDPLYGANGWRNVYAQPNGQLSYDGQSYESLYWEGTGLGLYPLITNGTVVAAKDAVPTIRNQLSAQGLNQKEINDFVTYWGPRMPQSNYVRLTWFNTAAMNELAPLNVSPKPDTTIRVFLDFQGLDHPISIQSPHFVAPKRTGFTVVEWGGLDRSAGVLK